MMGIPWSECETVSQLVGVKTVVNEFFAYQKLSHFIKEGNLAILKTTFKPIHLFQLFLRELRSTKWTTQVM
jgi:nucleoside permease NupC